MKKSKFIVALCLVALFIPTLIAVLSYIDSNTIPSDPEKIIRMEMVDINNQTYTFDPDRFSLMNIKQYAADQYIALHAHWNGKGVLFNLIPGLRYARLRELLVLKVADGGYRNDHQLVLAFPKN